jgi:hypothetical protein
LYRQGVAIGQIDCRLRDTQIQMPELPEVETMVRDLAARVVGRTVTGSDAPFTGTVRYPDYPEFAR